LLGKKSKKIISLVVKILFTTIALYVVFSKISIDDIKNIITTSNIFYLLLAFVFFNLSKILSSVRLNYYFHHIKVDISQLYALKLYYIGMFYNLFLPGGISGDGYKIYLLKKQNEHISIKDFFSATLLDRISGLVPLLFFAAILFIFSSYYGLYKIVDYLVIFGAIIVFPSLYIFTKYLFKKYLPLFSKTTILGTIVQFLQLLSAVSIVYALGNQQYLVEFLVLFLISSVVAVLPISIGGIGIREITFLYGLSLIGVPTTYGVAFALIFFLITALSSFVGIFLKHSK